jgi:WD40 repeat protein
MGCPHCLLRLAIPNPDAFSEGPEPARLPPAGLKSRFFGDYELLREIARGGMGVVYEARQLSLNRTVALKMIQAGHMLSVEARLRFRVEVEAVAQLNHPNIVSLHESGEHDGIHYFTMRLVDGGNLSEKLRKGGSLRADVALLIKVCRTVHYAHQRGILHRDLKPSNILLDSQGEPHVADFGLAKSLDQDSGFTYSSSILGSPNYMAPEQAVSHSGPVSTSADVYGLGAILYQILTGHPPFEGKTALETIRLVVDMPPVSPRKLNPLVDADLATICLRCLEKKPSDRYENAEELARELERWLQGLPILARPVGVIGTLWRWSRRRPAVSTLSGALALAVLVMLIGAPIAAVRIREAQREAVSHLRTSLLDQVRLLRLLRQPGVRAETIRLIRQAMELGAPAEFKDRARDELLAALAFTDMEFSPQIEVSSPDADLNLFDPTLARIASVTDRTNLVIKRLADGSEELRVTAVARSNAILRVESFSPDGRYLTVRHSQGLTVWDTTTGKPCLETNGIDRTFCFSRDSGRIFLEDDEKQISVLELPAGRFVRRLQPQPPGQFQDSGWRMIAVSPDGKQVAGARRGDSSLEMIEAESGRSLWRTDAAVPGAIIAVAWQPKQRRVITAGSDGVAYFRRWEDGIPMERLAMGAPARCLALDESNELLATAAGDKIVRLWSLVSFRQIFQVQCDVRELWFDESGSRLATVQRGRQAGWLDLSRSSEFQEMIVAGAGTWVDRCEFSADGRMVAGGFTRQVDIRRVTDGRCLVEIPIGGLPIFAFDPQGASLMTSDPRGIQRYVFEAEGPEKIKLHSPRRVVRGARWRSLAFSGDGQYFFAGNTDSNMVYVFDRAVTRVLGTLGPHQAVDALAVSRDGSRVASGSSTKRDVHVWDRISGSELFATSMSLQSRIALSPDGHWLLVHGDRLELVDLPARQPSFPIQFPGGWPLTGAACFSSDSRVLAVVVDQYQVQLFDLLERRALGRLRTPGDTRMVALAFSANASHLAAATSQGRLRVWNLARIRQRLAEVKLDWERAPFPASVSAPDTFTVEWETGTAER